MNLTYAVTKDNYIHLLAELIRRNERRPIKRIVFLLTTVGQMALVAILCSFQLDREQWPFFIIWSLLVAGVQTLRRLTVRQRAKGTLERFLYTNQLPEDYWKPHHLRETSEGLLLTFGGVRQLCAPEHLTRFEETGEQLHLYAGEGIFDIIPLSTFPTTQAKTEFLQALDIFRQRITPESGNPTSMEPPGGYGEVCCTYSLEGDAFCQAQVSAFRTLYLRYQFGRSSSLVRLAISVCLILNFLAQPSMLMGLFSLALILTMNMKHLTALTSLGRIRIQRELGDWKEGGLLKLSAGNAGIWFSNGQEYVLIPYGKINAMEKTKHSRVLSWGRFPAITIPEDDFWEPETQAFWNYVAEHHP